MKIKEKFAKVVCIGALLTAIGATNVFAGSYSGYTLPRCQGNNYTTQHAKKTTDNFIVNKVTALTGTSTVTFWAANSNKTQISNDYDQKVGSTATIKFTKRGYNKKGKEIMLGMENANWSLKNAFVSGNVDFR